MKENELNEAPQNQNSQRAGKSSEIALGEKSNHSPEFVDDILQKIKDNQDSRKNIEKILRQFSKLTPEDARKIEEDDLYKLWTASRFAEPEPRPTNHDQRTVRSGNACGK